MNKTRRTGVITIPTGDSMTVTMLVSANAKLLTANEQYVTARTVVETPNTLLVTAATVTLTDAADPTRFTLVASHVAPHNMFEYQIYFDSKYGDMLVVPTFELYTGIPYISNQNLEVACTTINFRGDNTGGVPPVNTGVVINSILTNLGTRTNNTSRAGYFEKMLTAEYNYSHPSMAPSLYINFGKPLALFTTLGFVAEVNMLSYDSITEHSEKRLGDMAISDTGILIARLPI